MIIPSFSENLLLLSVQGADKLWALKSELTIPLAHIMSAGVDTEVVNKWYHGIKAPGTTFPHVISAGTFYRDGKRIFWDIHHPEKAVVITLSDERYNELIFEVENPEVFVSELQAVIKKYSN